MAHTPPVESPAEVEYNPVPRSHRNPDEYSAVLRKEPICNNPYVSFAPKPFKVRFESQDPEEKIVLFVRRHGITNIGWIVMALIGLLVPLVLQFVPIIDFFPARFQFMTVVAWYVLITGFILESFLNWFFNVNIFTDERIIDIDFYSLLYKRISSAQIDRVEDVTSSVGGFWGSIFNYGDVEIQTAAQQKELTFEYVPQPQKIAQILNELILEEERENLEGRVR